MQFQRGDVIQDKYELTDVLGQGGMGIVYAARHRELGELVALKFLLRSQGDSPEVAARFLREARAGMRIKSEHVARVYDVGTASGAPFLVMEHLHGKDLAAILRERGALPVAEAVDLLLQACEAVNEAHTLGIVHRDLKPGNLFVTTPLDGFPVVKVLDFGISKSTVADEPSMTASAVVVGSPRYMSPEQLSAAKDVDARSDVWSLGVVLYEMLAGVPPFRGESFAEVCAAVLGADPPELSEHRPDLPDALDEIVSETFLLDREMRLQTVAAFAARLAPFGTDAARTSLERIRNLAAPASAPPSMESGSGEPLVAAGGDVATGGRGKPSVESEPGAPLVVAGGDVTTGARGATVLTQPGPVPVQAPTASRASRRWRRAAAVAGLGVVLGGVVLTFRAVSSPGASSSTPAGSAATACSGGATPACEAACAAHESVACQALATALAKGTGGPRDVPRAAQLYKAECDTGALAACNGLGALYGNGDGIPQDNAKAVELYTRACNGGYARSCMNLGAMHFDGTGVPKNEALGARFFLQGCEGGEPLACLNVSIAYGEGRGARKDAAQSLAFAARACDGGVQAGCVRLSAAKITGEGVTKDVKAGLAEIEAMCTQGKAAGCEELASMYRRGTPDVPADPLRARVYDKKACDAGSARGCGMLKVHGSQDSLDNTVGRAEAQFETQCNAGLMTSCAMLGEMLIAGPRPRIG